MRVGIVTVVVATGLLCVLCANGAVDTSSASDIGSRAALVDAKARELLGLGIRDLALLLEAKPNQFRPHSYEQRVGTLTTAQKLETNGYITIATTKGLPDGKEGREDFVSYLPTKKGQQVIDALGD